MFSREIDSSPAIVASDMVLPVRGSGHPAFVEMRFLWGASLVDDPRFRSVTMPAGFLLKEISESRLEVRDPGGFPRAVVLIPGGRGAMPSISPVRRFSFGADPLRAGFRGFVSDWRSIVYRTAVLPTQADALCLTKKWLDDNKPKWEPTIATLMGII